MKGASVPLLYGIIPRAYIVFIPAVPEGMPSENAPSRGSQSTARAHLSHDRGAAGLPRALR